MIPETSHTPESKPRAPDRLGPGAFPVRAAAASILAHAVVIAILVNLPARPTALLSDPQVISMRLVPAPAAPETASPEATVEQARDERVPETSGAVTSPPTVSPVRAPDARISDKPATDDDVNDPPGSLRATLLDQIRSQPANPDQATGNGVPWTPSGAPVPGLPGVRGWLSGYAGKVTPGADTWKDSDGTGRGRYVLANGTVVCTRRRAPTIDELMNPWKSTAVTMGSICGRERPASPDFSNPRVQPPPTAGGRPETTD